MMSMYAAATLILFLDTDERFKPPPEETFIWAIIRRFALGEE